MKTMFVVESPVDVVRLLDEGVKINEVNVGGVTFKTGMVQLSDAVYASEEHLEAYRELIKRGVKLTVQQPPNHSPVDLEKILKQKAWTHERPDVYSRCSRGVHCGRRIRGGRASVPPPLVACALMGFALGDPTTGIMLGGALELIALGWMNVGAAMAPDSALASTISAVVVIQGHQDITTGIAIAVPLAAAGQVLTIFVRTITVFFQHQADNFAKTANFRGIELMHISGMALQGLRVAIPTAIVALRFPEELTRLLNMIPPR